MLLYLKLKILLKKILKKNSPYIVGSGSIINNTSIEMRRGPIDSSRCRFGNNSIISGSFVLETEKSTLTIGDRTFIGGGQFIVAEKITIGSDVLISWGCTFIDTDAHSTKWELRKDDVKDWKKGLDAGQMGKYKNWTNVISKEIRIGDKSWIGFNSIILKGVEVGEGAIIGTGSVVTEDVPPFTLYAGNPAKFVKNLR